MAASMTVKSATRVAQGQRFVNFMLQYFWVFVCILGIAKESFILSFSWSMDWIHIDVFPSQIFVIRCNNE